MGLTASSRHQPTVLQWLVRTNSLLKDIDTQLPPKEQMKQFALINSDILSLLSKDDRDGVLKYFFPADASMSLLSHLLKRLIISKSIDIPFSQVVVSRDEAHGKPCYAASPALGKSVSFNVSHQAGMVALLAIPQQGNKEEFDVGVDVVFPNERGELDRILRERNKRQAFDDFVEMHSEVFSPHEISALKLPSSGRDAEEWLEEEITHRLRQFYALWCLREAYVKMTGEALLAEWLQELEFRHYPVPFPTPEAWEEGRVGNPHQKDGPLAWEGEYEMWFKGRKVEGVECGIVGVGSRFMVARAVRRKDKGKVDVVWSKLEEVSVEDVAKRCREAL